MASHSSYDDVNHYSPNVSNLSATFTNDSENTEASYYTARSDQEREDLDEVFDESEGFERPEGLISRAGTLRQTVSLDERLVSRAGTLKQEIPPISTNQVGTNVLSETIGTSGKRKDPVSTPKRRSYIIPESSGHIKSPISPTSPTSVYLSDDDSIQRSISINERLFREQESPDRSFTAPLNISKAWQETSPLKIRKSTRIDEESSSSSSVSYNTIPPPILKSINNPVSSSESITSKSNRPNLPSPLSSEYLPLPVQSQSQSQSQPSPREGVYSLDIAKQSNASLVASPRESLQDVAKQSNWSLPSAHVAEIAEKPKTSPRLSETSKYSDTEKHLQVDTPNNGSSLSNYSSDTPLLQLVEASPIMPHSKPYESPYASKPSSPFKSEFGTAQILYSSPNYNKYEYDNGLKSAFALGKHSNKEVAINPFEVIYDTTNQTASGKQQLAVHAFDNKSYHDIEIGLQQGTHHTRVLNRGHLRIVSESAPIVTIIDEPKLNRSGSIISRNASLRYRGSIKSRAKMVSRNELESNDSRDREGNIQKLKRYFFPVKRKTSLKYSKVDQSKPNFESKQQLQAFMNNNNYTSIIRELLPYKLEFFHYSKLFYVNPNLHKETKRVKINDNNDISVAARKIPNKHVEISSPLKGTATQNGSPINLKSTSLYDMAYERYRKAVFKLHSYNPPKFEALFSSDYDLLSKQEMNKLNKTLLLEILMRRTLAAKIGYRLSRHGAFKNKSNNVSSSDSPSSFSTSHGLAKNSRGKSKNISDQPPPLTKDSGSSDEGDDELDSVDTAILMKQNASLMSEMLPSPQISFGSFKLKSSPIQPSSIYSSEKQSTDYAASFELYINEFNSKHQNKTNKPNDHTAIYLNNTNHQKQTRNPKELRSPIYQLKPLRSEVTNSSKSSLSTQSLDFPQFKTDSQGSSTDKLKSSYTSSIGKSRKGYSSNTSVLQGLEKSYSLIESYISPPPRKKVEERSSTLPNQYHSAELINSTLQQDVLIEKFGKHANSIRQGKARLDIKSMHGSISVGEASSYFESANSSESKYLQSPQRVRPVSNASYSGSTILK